MTLYSITQTPKEIFDLLYSLRLRDTVYDPVEKKYVSRDPSYHEVTSRYKFIVVDDNIYYQRDQEEWRVKAYNLSQGCSFKRMSLPDAVIVTEMGVKKVLKNRYGKDQLPRENRHYENNYPRP